MSVLFSTDGFFVRRLLRSEAPALQALFEANPDAFICDDGHPPGPNLASEEFDELPPPHIPYGELFFAGIFDSASVLQGQIVIVSDLMAKTVWQVAIALLDSRFRGTGVAVRLHAALEVWARSSGARWLRVAITSGNVAAERFCARSGYEQVRTLQRTNASAKAVTTRILVKPLAGGTTSEYLALMSRDLPNSLPKDAA